MEWKEPLLKIWLTLSVLILLCKTYYLDFFSYKDKKGNSIWIYTIGISAFIALLFFFERGYTSFIPESWGSYSKDGEWSSSTSYLGFMTAAFCLQILKDIEFVRKKLVSLEAQLERHRGR